MGGFRGFIRFFNSLCADDRGQATTEYILLLSVVITGAVGIGKVILSTIDQGILRVGAQLEMDLQTGRAPPSVWQN
jgi:hypothetical protein